jgi:hypothetical protein
MADTQTARIVFAAVVDSFRVSDFSELEDIDLDSVEFKYIDAWDNAEDSERERMVDPIEVPWDVFDAVAYDVRDTLFTALADCASESRAWGGSSDWDD